MRYTLSQLIAEATNATDESTTIEFKENFLNEHPFWCEIVKDIVAMSNTDGGIIVFGILDNGQSIQDFDTQKTLSVDLADIANKVFSFTRIHISGLKWVEISRSGKTHPGLFLTRSNFPIVFSHAGNYVDPENPKRQKNAFNAGSIYFRHGSKSEPGVSEDIRNFIEYEIRKERTTWLDGVAKLTEAPRGANVQIVVPSANISSSATQEVRLTDNPSAQPAVCFDPDKLYPYRTGEAAKAVSKRLGSGIVVSSSLIILVRKCFKITPESRSDYCYKSRHSSPQFSEKFIDWIVEEIQKDPDFFVKMKKTLVNSSADVAQTAQGLKIEVSASEKSLKQMFLKYCPDF